jgi:hypothetical protein
VKKTKGIFASNEMTSLWSAKVKGHIPFNTVGLI